MPRTKHLVRRDSKIAMSPESTYQLAWCTVRVGTCTQGHESHGRQMAGVYIPVRTVHSVGWYLHTGTQWKANGWGLHTSPHCARCGLVPAHTDTRHVEGKWLGSISACTVHGAGWYLHTGTQWKANGWGLHTSPHGAWCGLVPAHRDTRHLEGKWLGSTCQPARCTVRVGTCTHGHTAHGRQMAGVYIPASTVHGVGWYLHTVTHGK